MLSERLSADATRRTGRARTAPGLVAGVLRSRACGAISRVISITAGGGGALAAKGAAEGAIQTEDHDAMVLGVGNEEL